MPKKLTGYEKETVINFNEAEAEASIFTYNRTWQKHLENKLKLKPVMNNGFGGKEYHIDKHRIRPPRIPVQLSAEAKRERAERLALTNKNAILSANKP